MFQMFATGAGLVSSAHVTGNAPASSLLSQHFQPVAAETSRVNVENLTFNAGDFRVRLFQGEELKTLRDAQAVELQKWQDLRREAKGSMAQTYDDMIAKTQKQIEGVPIEISANTKGSSFSRTYFMNPETGDPKALYNGLNGQRKFSNFMASLSENAYNNGINPDATDMKSQTAIKGMSQRLTQVLDKIVGVNGNSITAGTSQLNIEYFKQPDKEFEFTR